MGQSMLPILVLTTVALSSSDVLPILTDKDANQPFNIDYQENDNTFSKRYRYVPHNILYNKRIIQDKYITQPNINKITEANYVFDNDNNYEFKYLNQRLNKEENYDDEGYRKEQWHNYPRQLDRLQKLHYKHDNFIETPKSDDDDPIKSHIDDFISNEFRLNGDEIYDSDADIDPFLILKVQLAYLRDDLTNHDLNEHQISSSPESDVQNEEDNKSISNIIDPTDYEANINTEKSKRNRGNLSNKKTVKKRLFSLWSRLQSLSHRGHELHHRRHLHAFYGLPDNNGNGIVTAQTRASFVRPPGSPLRWGR
ncbi:uncharacterized protein [Battus philenor]|uniref:uncharacterized protein n=1 Tax=Battus philenor TaxID=42288 RepID=UPI0035D06F42